MSSTMFLSMVLCATFAVVSMAEHPPQTPTYVVKNGKTTCFILTASISYDFVLLESNMTVTGIFGEPSIGNLTVTGQCSNETAMINITDTEQDPAVSVAFSFTNNGTAWFGTLMAATVSGVDIFSSISFLTASEGQQYMCQPVSDVLLSDNVTEIFGNVSFADLRLQPFGVVNNTLSSNVANCVAPSPVPSPSNIVPIAVGAGLCVLVVVVVIAYITGRTRHSNRGGGYQSVDGETH